MEKEQPTKQTTPFGFNLEFKPTLETPAWAKAFMEKFDQQEKRVRQLEKYTSGLKQLMEEMVETKAELERTQSVLEQVTAERNALLLRYQGSGASIHATSESANGLREDFPALKDKNTAKAVPELSPSDKERDQTMADIVKKQGDSTKKPMRRRVTAGQRRAAARVFSEPPQESGFTTAYLPCRRRMPIHELRKRLHQLKIVNARVLDVSYPANKVVALLVHQEYVKELLERFDAAGVKIIENFDPLSPSVLTDPKWKELGEDDRAAKATDAATRILADVDFILVQVQFSNQQIGLYNLDVQFHLF